MAQSRRRLIVQSYLPAQHFYWRRLAERPAGGLGRMGARTDISEEVGFMLPLAMITSLALLLGSLSVQGLAIQRHMSYSIALKSRAKGDGLTSSAQIVAGALQLSGSCLLKKDYNILDNNSEWKNYSGWGSERCNSSFLSSLTGSISGSTYEVIDYKYNQNHADAKSSSGTLVISWGPVSKVTQKTFTLSIDSSIDPPKLLGVTP